MNDGPAERIELATKSRIALTASSLDFEPAVSLRASSAAFAECPERSRRVRWSSARYAAGSPA